MIIAIPLSRELQHLSLSLLLDPVSVPTRIDEGPVHSLVRVGNIPTLAFLGPAGWIKARKRVATLNEQLVARRGKFIQQLQVRRGSVCEAESEFVSGICQRLKSYLWVNYQVASLQIPPHDPGGGASWLAHWSSISGGIGTGIKQTSARVWSQTCHTYS